MTQKKYSKGQSPNGPMVVDSPQDLPIRSKTPPPSYKSSLLVDLHPLPGDEGLLVSVRPPTYPQKDIKHVSCDIVLVIDVSGSMASPAPLPDVAADATDKESTGLSILDLTKHAARTVLENLNEDDRLGIVTFSEEAKIVQSLTRMTKDNKKQTWEKIDKLQPTNSTNLWGGIRTGLKVFDDALLAGNSQGLYVLTDGMPNHMCPPQGYVAKLRPMLDNIMFSRGCVPTIHTFGFGYSIRSDLMQSIAEVGNGNYAFIPDAGMIGTVFVHAVANLFNTFATSAELDLKVCSPTPQAKLSVNECHATQCTAPSPDKLSLRLGSLQYGQTRDVIVKYENAVPGELISATIRYAQPEKKGEVQTVSAETSLDQLTSLPRSAIDYHVSRTQLCNILTGLFPLKENGEHTTQPEDKIASFQESCEKLAQQISNSTTYGSNENLQALHNDLVGEDPIGQITKAFLTKSPTKVNYWLRWGRHYLPSILHAHLRQVCNSFKDPGPLRYGIDAPLFIKCRNELDAAFDNLPAPKPTLPPPMVYDSNGVGRRGKHSYAKMSRYNSCSNPCFEGDCQVVLGDGQAALVQDLKAGSMLWTPIGARKAVAIVKTQISGRKQPLCRISDLWVTPWHPIQVHDQWVFPAEVAEEVKMSDTAVYSILLEPSSNPDAHAVKVGGQLCVTLGHGMTDASTGISDVRIHSFFGNYQAVTASLAMLKGNTEGQLICAGVRKDGDSGLVCDFLNYEEMSLGSTPQDCRVLFSPEDNSMPSVVENQVNVEIAA